MPFDMIIGPMFAGKTDELIRRASRFQSIGKKVLAVNHKLDDRYGTSKISSHDQRIWDQSISLDRLTGLEKTEQYKESDVIMIEEVQFFRDAFDFVTNAVDNDGKHLIVAGLSGDFKREPFGDVLRLIPHCDNLIKLSAYCCECADGTPAHFSKIMKIRRRTSRWVERRLTGQFVGYIICQTDNSPIIALSDTLFRIISPLIRQTL